MAIPNSPEDRSIDEPASGENTFESGAPSHATSGAGFTVAPPYLIFLATGTGYDHMHRLRSPRPDPTDIPEFLPDLHRHCVRRAPGHLMHSSEYPY
ncbi:hypothetical protein PWP93_19330 [Paraburkholderia sp. A1RI-2L]|uniref:hypothetical protein n=1 Tax=Paraburkholderia sp. A1RI-2L TaxID=3028367 RepID=UPI003B7704CF